MSRALRWSRQLLPKAALALALVACGNDASNIEVPPLQVTTATTGPGTDPDGYALSIDGDTAISMGVNDTLVVGDAAAGQHVVALSGVSSNCQLQGQASDTITVTDGSTAVAAFAVACAGASPGNGSLEVTTSTSGGTGGAVNYAVLLDGRRVGSAVPNGTMTVGGISTGTHTIGLDELGAGCTVSGENPQSIGVAADSTSTASFTITCSSSPGGAIGRWNLVTSQKQSARLYDVWGSAANDFWVVGTDYEQGRAGIIKHYDGTAWTETLQRTDIQLDAVWGAGPSDVYAVGAHNDAHAGAILHYDGSAWSEISGPSVTPAPGDTLVLWQSVWGLSASDIYVVGASYGNRITGLAAHYDGAGWTSFTLPTTTDREPLDIWGTSPQNLYIAGVLHDPTDTSTAHDHGLILHYDGTNWTESLHGPEGVHLKAVWGSSQADIYAVGDPGIIVRWDGSSWTEQPQLITAALHEVWGTSSSNVYAVAARGSILHFDGTQWSKMESPTRSDLYGLWGSAPDDAWTAGNSELIVHGTP